MTFAIDQWIRFCNPDVLAGIHYSTWGSGPSLIKGYSNNLFTLLGNVFFLQTILTPVFGSNDPLWSLANEFWYYIIFPLFAYAAGQCYDFSKPPLFARIGNGLIALLLLLSLPSEMRTGFFIWLLGVLVYIFLDRVKKIARPWAIVGAVILVGALAYSKSSALQATLNIPSDVVVGLGSALFCLSVVNLPSPQNSSSLGIKSIRWLSECSYSLYLSHFPAVVLIGTLFYGSSQMQPNLNGFVQFFGWLGVILAIASAFWWLFERNTNVVRKVLVKSLLDH